MLGARTSPSASRHFAILFRRKIIMKRTFTLTLSLICALFVASAIGAQEHGEGHGGHNFPAPQFDRFHDILHPLQHEALPNNDFRTIRARAGDLYNAGRAILRLSVPRSATNAAELRRKRAEFSRALSVYRRDARRASDAQLRASYERVHDTFEELAHLWPRR